MAPVTVAVINSSIETIEMLSTALRAAGLSVATALTRHLLDGTVDLAAFMREHDPSVVLYDVAAPYEANWMAFKSFRAHPEVAARPVVLTSTDADAVQQLARTDPAVIGIASKPFDLDRVIQAAQDAAQLPVRELRRPDERGDDDGRFRQRAARPQ